MDIKEKIKLIADTYGYDAQSRQCIEEMAELTQAINKLWRKQLSCGAVSVEDVKRLEEDFKSLTQFKTEKNYRNLVGEIADVQIMLYQVAYLLDAVEDVNLIAEQKVERQIERIEGKECMSS